MFFVCYNEIMQRSLKRNCLILAIIVAILLATLVVYTMPKVSYAYTNDININLDANSKYCVSGGNFAYSKGNDIYIAADNTLLKKQSAFDGTLIDMTMNDEYFVLLSSLSKDKKSLKAYRYHDKTTNTFLSNPTAVTIDFSDNGTQLGQILDGIEGLSTTGDKFYIRHKSHIKELSFTSLTLPLFHNDNYSQIDNFFVWTKDTTNYIIYQKGGELFKNSNQAGLLPDPTFTFSQSTILSCDMQGDFVYANCLGGVYKIDKTSGSAVKLATMPSETIPQGKIDACELDGKTYLYFLDNGPDAVNNGTLAIKMFNLANDTISYLNSFDSVVYRHPVAFDVLAVAKLAATTSMFISPKNKTTIKVFGANDTLFLLSKVNNFYYATDGDGNFGYIDNANLTILKNGQVSSFGKNAQALHNETKIYQYPYKESNVLDTIDVFTVLSIIYFVGVENEASLWEWCNISYVTSSGETKNGYVHISSIAPYTNYTPPIVFKQAKIKSDKLGTAVNVYLLPNAESEILVKLTDGEKVNLGQKFVNGSDWTKILINGGEGYVQTKYLQSSGLTGLQIAMITISCVIFVVMTTTLTIIFVKKKKAAKPY